MSLALFETEMLRDRNRRHKAVLVKCAGCDADILRKGGRKRCVPCADILRAQLESVRKHNEYLRKKANSPEGAPAIPAESYP
jgi:hypothetical protein